VAGNQWQRQQAQANVKNVYSGERLSQARMRERPGASGGVWRRRGATDAPVIAIMRRDAVKRRTMAAEASAPGITRMSIRANRARVR